MLRSLLCLTAFSLMVAGQAPEANYDESKVRPYLLPDPLRMEDGTRVTSAAMWTEKRRPELIRLFETNMHGRAPARPANMIFEVMSTDQNALGGTAIRKLVTVYFTGKKDGPRMDMLLYLPRGLTGPVPIFLGLNFSGNHTVVNDPGVPLTKTWISGGPGVVDHHATEKARGTSAGQWQVARILERGYGLATIYYGDIVPDQPNGFQDELHKAFYRPGQSKPDPDEWGDIAAWAWGLSRAMDYLESDRSVDAKRVAVMGHSRLGKATLWAGAVDTRFAMVIPNDSGEGGVALSHRNFGETVAQINKRFPHWFNGNYTKWSDNEAAMPVDAHELVALVAPRPVYIANAKEDRWADPYGEFLAAKAATPVYRLFGMTGIDAEEMPPLETPLTGRIGYHVRAGGHDVTPYDWERFIEFADRWMK